MSHEGGLNTVTSLHQADHFGCAFESSFVLEIDKKVDRVLKC